MGIHEYRVSGSIYKKLVTVVATDEGGGLFVLFLKFLPDVYMPCHSSTDLNDDDKASLQFVCFFPSIMVQVFFRRFVVCKQNIVYFIYL